MPRSKFLREIRQYLLRLGASNITIEQSKHFKIRFDFNGRNFVTVAPVTASDVRSAKNLRSDIRRMMNNAT